MTVHIWTPEGTANTSNLSRTVMKCYIAAVDSAGIISIGHAALERLPSVSISLYPAVDIDRSLPEFLNIMKATKDNDVPGIFQPNYASEAASWCDSDRKICFHDYNSMVLRRYWNAYKQTKTYNLTYRNCSSSVAYALEVALDGVLSKQSRSGLKRLQTLMMLELGIAARLRIRALSMAWMPGCLDAWITDGLCAGDA